MEKFKNKPILVFITVFLILYAIIYVIPKVTGVIEIGRASCRERV